MTLRMERRIPIGSAPDQWEEDWPVPFFLEADQLLVTIDREHRVITNLAAMSGGIAHAEYAYTEIETESGLTPEDFDEYRLDMPYR
ncbi:MAG: hypothetical protein QM589_13580 [Thermomicrobiales bacterium]